MSAAAAWAHRQKGLRPSAKAVLVQICAYPTCFASATKLGAQLGIGEQTVRRAIADLRADGFLAVQHRPGRTLLIEAMAQADQKANRGAYGGRTPVKVAEATPVKVTGHPGQSCPPTPVKVTDDSLKKEESRREAGGKNSLGKKSRKEPERRQAAFLLPLSGMVVPAPQANAWERVRTRAATELQGQCVAYFRQISFRGIEDGTEAVLELPTKFLRDWVRSQHELPLLRVIQAELPEVRWLTFRVAA